MIREFSPKFSTRSEVLDLLPPIARDAAYAIHALTRGADEGLIRAQIIAVMAAACAPLYRLRLPHWKPIPLHIPVIVVGRSGVSKSPILGWLEEPFDRFTVCRGAAFAKEVEAYEIARTLQAARADDIRRAMRTAKDDADRLAMDGALQELLASLPAPRQRGRAASHVDFEKLIHLLHGRNEAVDFLFHEGDHEIGSLLFRKHAGTFNAIFDGTARLDSTQQRRKSVSATDPNVALLFLLRESALERFHPVEKGGKIVKSTLVDIGFFARGLVYATDQLPRASGLWGPEDPDGAVRTFNDWIYDMLERHHAQLVEGNTDRIELELAPEAVEFWISLDDGIRLHRAKDESPIDEYFGKLLSVVSRVAALFHLAESDSRFVSLSALQRAWDVVVAHEEHYAHAFAPPPPPKQVEHDAVALMNLLGAQVCSPGGGARSIKVKACAVKLGISDRRVQHAASRLEDVGQVSLVNNATVIDFRNVIAFPRSNFSRP